MYRQNCLRGCCLSAFGIGLLAGHCMESWLLCCGGGLLLVILGFFVMRKK